MDTTEPLGVDSTCSVDKGERQPGVIEVVVEPSDLLLDLDIAIRMSQD